MTLFFHLTLNPSRPNLKKKGTPRRKIKINNNNKRSFMFLLIKQRSRRSFKHSHTETIPHYETVLVNCMNAFYTLPLHLHPTKAFTIASVLLKPRMKLDRFLLLLRSFFGLI